MLKKKKKKLLFVCFFDQCFSRPAFHSAIAKYISPPCHKVIIIFWAQMIYLAVAFQRNRETPHR